MEPWLIIPITPTVLSIGFWLWFRHEGRKLRKWWHDALWERCIKIEIYRNYRKK